MQTHQNQLLVYISDDTYDRDEAHELGEQEASEAFRRRLEANSGVPFYPANIGVGADWPAFVTTLGDALSDWWPIAIATLFAGKPLKDSLTAWHDMAKKIKQFATHRAFPNRSAAAVLAVDEVTSRTTDNAFDVRLLNWHAVDTRCGEEILVERDVNEDILGYVEYHFCFEVNSKKIVVKVRGLEVT